MHNPIRLAVLHSSGGTELQNFLAQETDQPAFQPLVLWDGHLSPRLLSSEKLS